MNHKRLISLLIIFLIVILLAGCSNSSNEQINVQEQEQEQEQAVQEEKKPTQEELNAKMKEEATEIEFIDAFRGNVDKDAKVKIRGTIEYVLERGSLGEYGVVTDEDLTDGDGNKVAGIYHVYDFSLTEDELNEGEIIKIWGVYGGKDDDGAPIINATIIEKIE